MRNIMKDVPFVIALSTIIVCLFIMLLRILYFRHQSTKISHEICKIQAEQDLQYEYMQELINKTVKDGGGIVYFPNDWNTNSDYQEWLKKRNAPSFKKEDIGETTTISFDSIELMKDWKFRIEGDTLDKTIMLVEEYLVNTYNFKIEQ